VIALAETLGLPFETVKLGYSPLRRLGPRLLGGSFASLTRASRELLLRAPPPDLTISVGHRSVPAVRALRRRSGHRTRSIHIGFPRVSPGCFDLVVTTPQYPVADHPNVLRLPYALTRLATETVGEHFDALPRPHRLLVIGGPNPFWDLDRKRLLDTLAAMLGEAVREGGSVLVTTSPRTPEQVRDELARTLECANAPTLLASPGAAPSYPALLATADSIHVTADSVAMVSDAIWTGKPMSLVGVRPSRLGRLAMALNHRVRPGCPLYPQDLRFFWRALEAIGIGERLAVPRTSTADILRLVRNRANAVLDRRA
jgi:mitochondrial fission protein ELM1